MKRLSVFLFCFILLLAPLFAGGKKEEPAGPVTIKFSGWTYDMEKAKDNLAKFEKWVAAEASPPIPDVKVDMSDAGYGEFDTHITTSFSAGNPLDAMYSSDQWLAKWAEAGWVVPLEDYWPKVKEYVSDIAPFSIEAMTYKGKLYGLPYYTDVMYFAYNKKILADAGISAPPTTWADVTEQCAKIMKAGLSTEPLLVGLKAGSWFDEAFFTFVFSEGGSLFNKNLEATFATDSGPVFDILEWIRKSINDTKIMPRKVIEMTAVDVQQAFKKGGVAFAIVPGYMMAEFNAQGKSDVVGQADVALMPGKAHVTDGYTRMYLLGKSALRDKRLQQASIDLIEFLGGKVTLDGVSAYHIPKRWAVANGLGFSILSLWSDPEVQKRFATMGSTSVMKKQKEMAKPKEGIAAPWFAEWISTVRTEVQNGILGQKPMSAALDTIKKQWANLKKEK